ncbi:MAG: glycosyltransferase [Acidimicrobiales bacterium]
MSERPLIAVLTNRWESKTEEGWATRQVAGALACAADVHVITPQGRAPVQRTDSVFTLHELGTPSGAAAEIRRDLLIEAISETGSGVSGRLLPEFGRLLDRDLLECWNGASDLISGLQPDLVVVAGHQLVGAIDAVDRVAPELPVMLLALGSDLYSLSFSHFARVFDRAQVVLAITETERLAIIDRHGGPARVHRIGAPLAANSSVLNEPNTWVGKSDYVFVITGAKTRADEETVTLARLIRLRFPENPVAISATDALSAWHQGRLGEGWPVERSSDLNRLMAWARVVVDLRPGPLLGRRAVDSLLYGTPIVVPGNSRAREHAELGGGGLWFDTPGELAWCVEAMLDPEVRAVFSAQGRAYAEAAYGSTDGFIERVLRAAGDAGTGDGVPGIGGAARMEVKGGSHAADAGLPAGLSITA